MKKLSILIFMILAVANLSLADEGELEPVQSPAVPQARTDQQEAQKTIVKQVSLKTGASGAVSGKVANVLTSDDLSRTRSRITITDNEGNTTEFMIKTLAVIYDSTGRFLTLNHVQAGQEVLIDYVTKRDGSREAVSIKILK